MTTIGAPSGPIPYRDRDTQISQYVDFNNRREGVPKKTIEEATMEFNKSDEIKMQQAVSDEMSYRGEGTYLGSSKGNETFWDPHGYQNSLEQVRAERSRPYSQMSGPINIEALNVNSAIAVEGKLTANDLKNISYYSDYMRNEVAAAKSVNSNVTFTGSWGKNRVTHDLNEYIGWLMQAAKEKT